MRSGRNKKFLMVCLTRTKVVMRSFPSRIAVKCKESDFNVELGGRVQSLSSYLETINHMILGPISVLTLASFWYVQWFGRSRSPPHNKAPFRKIVHRILKSRLDNAKSFSLIHHNRVGHCPSSIFVSFHNQSKNNFL